ncbi:EpsG family protein [Photobacterium leiognathi]|uniref:EpsG family protein n=1 Tax=Photobacterium leiognathi TaxID=553611 RepID=UPI003AF3B933
MIYYVIFLILALFSFTDNLKDKRYSSLSFIISFFILFLFGSLRYDTGWDFATYRFYFERTDTINVFLTNGFSPSVYFEFGFKLLISIIKSLGLGFQSFIFICNLFVVSCLYYFINRNIKYKNSAILLFYSLCYLFINLSILRQGIAASFLLLAIDSNFNNKNSYKTYSYIFISTLFHFSSIVFIPLIFVSQIFKVKQRAFLLFISSIIFISLVNIPIFEIFYHTFHSILPSDLNEKFEFYINSTRFGVSRAIGFGFIEKVFFLILLFHYFIVKNNLTHKEAKNINLIVLMLLSYFAIYVLFIDVQVIYTRLKFYFMIVASCYYPLFIYEFLNKQFSKQLGVVICISFSFINLYNTLRFEPNKIVFIPYQTIITEPPSYLTQDYYRIDRAQEIIKENQNKP